MIGQTLASIGNSARIIPFQGTLTNSTGANVADGNYSITFKLYSVSTGGTALWSETQSSVAVSSGAFSVNIGTNDANGVNVDLNTPPYYLGITIGANAEMTPRIQLGMAPFSMNGFDLSSGMVAFFNLSACPTGWTDKTSTWGGRYLVANPSSGTLAATVGTALTNTENRVVGPHTHTITDPGHSHTYSFGVAGGGSGGYNGNAVASYGTSGNATGISINNTGTNISATAGTNAPYVQLLVCQKN